MVYKLVLTVFLVVIVNQENAIIIRQITPSLKSWQLSQVFEATLLSWSHPISPNWFPFTANLHKNFVFIYSMQYCNTHVVCSRPLARTLCERNFKMLLQLALKAFPDFLESAVRSQFTLWPCKHSMKPWQWWSVIIHLWFLLSQCPASGCWYLIMYLWTFFEGNYEIIWKCILVCTSWGYS